MNIERKEDYNQVCVWPGTMIGSEIKKFEKFMLESFKVRVQYLEEIKTLPDTKGDTETGGRIDVFFAIHKDDVAKFSLSRFTIGVRWIEDVLSKENYRNKIYPKRVFKYKTWDC